MKKYLFLLAIITTSKMIAAQNAVGSTSFASGQGTTASGNTATAMGFSTTANGDYSTALGCYVHTNGQTGSFVIGDYNFNGTITKAQRANQMVMRFTGGYRFLTDNNLSASMVITPQGEVSMNKLTVNGRTDISGDLSISGSILSNLGIGGVNDATTPNTRLLVRQGISGASRHPGTILAVEGSVNSYISILTPAANEGGILFGSPSSPAMGGIIYNNNHLTDPNSIYFRVNNGTKMAIYNNGNAWLLGSLTQASDARMKKDIHLLQNSLSKIMQLNGYFFHWKDESADNSMQVGIMAQEVQKLFPELVREDAKGMLSVNYSGLIPVIIESIKEQQRIIEKQQQQIDELKRMVEALLKR